MQGESLENLVAACHDLADRGYALSTSGNLSVRHKDGILLTATGMSLRDVGTDNLAWTNLQGDVLNDVAPTKESAFHLAVYRRRPDVNAVIHLHPTHSVAASTLLPAKGGRHVPAVTPQFVMRAGKVPIIPYHPPGSAQIAEAMGKRCNGSAILLQNHGVITFSQTMKKAVGVLEELEENCRLWLLVRNEGRLLSEEEVGHLIETYWKSNVP